jgi:hypothetical protein
MAAIANAQDHRVKLLKSENFEPGDVISRNVPHPAQEKSEISLIQSERFATTSTLTWVSEIDQLPDLHQRCRIEIATMNSA